MGTRHLHEILSERQTISGTMQVMLLCHAIPYNMHTVLSNSFASSICVACSIHKRFHFVQVQLDEVTEAWGIKVERVEM